ncbi:hypothetical protein GEMRC1_007912 [Eukaryota sp. GEM-RC1]
MNPNDTISILVASDLHLGHASTDPVRQNDPFVAFEEILNLAHAHSVDLLLLGGDIFHERKPSQFVLRKTFQLLTKYCFGDKHIQLSVLTDQSELVSKRVNFLNENINVSLPIFTINGNHDEPTGDSNISPLDVLSEAGLINYLGKLGSLTPNSILVKPCVLEKGQTKIALYGLPYVNESRMHRLFENDRVAFDKPYSTGEVFNILLLHQSRHQRAGFQSKAYMTPDYIKKHELIDLIVWGHEHFSDIVSNQVPEIIQPGSPVPTSMHKSNQGIKYASLVQVNKCRRKITRIPLLYSRYFNYFNLSLHDEFGDYRPSEAEICVTLKVKTEEFLERMDVIREEIKQKELQSRVESGFNSYLTEIPVYIHTQMARVKVDFGDLPLFSSKNLILSSSQKLSIMVIYSTLFPNRNNSLH